MSIAEDGKLVKCKDFQDLKQKLKDAMNDSNVTKSFKTILARSKKE